jgi:hypothetical protein
MGWPFLPWPFVISPVVLEPSLLQGPSKKPEVVDAKTALLLGLADYVTFY